MKLPTNAGEDSLSILPVLLGDAGPSDRAIVHHSINGRFAIRAGRWKLCFCAGSGGWGQPGDAEAAKQGLPDAQLYDLSTDIGETTNFQHQHPDVVKRLTDLLQQYIDRGRSTPGEPQQNNGEVTVWRQLD